VDNSTLPSAVDEGGKVDVFGRRNHGEGNAHWPKIDQSPTAESPHWWGATPFFAHPWSTDLDPRGRIAEWIESNLGMIFHG